MLRSLLFFALILVSLPGQAYKKYPSAFYDRAMAGIQMPALEQPIVAAQTLAIWGESRFRNGISPQPQHSYWRALPRAPETASRKLVPGGILLTALGGAGIALGAASLQDDSSENAVSFSLIISSAILVLIGVWVMIAVGAR